MRALLVAAFTAALAVPAAAQDEGESTGQVRRGEALLARLCASCHAIGRSGRSPLAKARAFRTLGRRYKMEALEEALAEGLISNHPDMPEFQFSPPQVGAIIAYLNSIQER